LLAFGLRVADVVNIKAQGFGKVIKSLQFNFQFFTYHFSHLKRKRVAISEKPKGGETDLSIMSRALNSEF
jgi:hypothetical protein